MKKTLILYLSSLMAACIIMTLISTFSMSANELTQYKPPKPSAAVPMILQNKGGFDGSIVLGRPTSSDMTASITSNQPMQVYLAWGPSTNAYVSKSKLFTSTPLKPAVIIMDGLKEASTTHYKLYFKSATASIFSSTPDYSFKTPKQEGQNYSFVVQSDSHLKNKADRDLYAQSMKTIAESQPDFMFDLGDTFLNDQDNDPQNTSYEAIRKTSVEQLPYFDQVTRQAPLFLAIGNHEGEYGAFLDGTTKNMAAMSTMARTTYYPNPVPNNFYTGNTQSEAGMGQPQNYYAFTWGDALYVSIDPYRYSTNDPYNDKDGWQWTLGKTQYDWFKKTLSTSDAKYKFVFSHHAIGNMRGGLELAKLYEWGGYNRNGQYLFDQKRPGWGKPIQQIMKESGVTIFFQGHDHLFAREMVDGVVYQTLPKPAEKIADAQNNYGSYPKGDVLINSGFLKVDVTSAQVKVDYYRNYFVSSESQTGKTEVVYSYTVDAKHQVKVLKITKDDLTKYGGQNNNPPGNKNNPKGGAKNKPEQTGTSTNVTGGVTSGSLSTLLSSQNKSVSGILLGAPTDTSIEAKAVAYKAGSAYFEYGTALSNLTEKTTVVSAEQGDMIQETLGQLKSDNQYYYKMFFKEKSSEAYSVVATGTFHTQRSTGKSFAFTVQADPHRDENSDLDLYATALKNVLSEKPDFHVDLGDTFMGEKLGRTETGVLNRYLEDRTFFETIGSQVPLYLVNGNHEGENGWSSKNNDASIVKWALENRLKYFVNPNPGTFYTGSETGKGNYYAYTWGDALFVMLDPYTFSQQKAQSNTDGWNYTLGKVQYTWLKSTLEKSPAKYKFIFIHNLVGGVGKDSRGGAEASKFFEWGGYEADGTYGFDAKRPGWGKPIHQLLIDNKVSAVFHGHDHFYAKQVQDGIVYQLVPQPSHPGSDVRNAAEYSYLNGDFLPPAGHLRVTVSEKGAKVDYITASTRGGDNGATAATYTILPK